MTQKSPVVLAAMAYTVMAMCCFAVLDTTNKFLFATVPLLMVLWFRYMFQAVITTAVMWPKHGRTLFRAHNYKLQIVRGMLLLLCSALAFFSLLRMPVAEFTAINMLTPLVVTLLAHFVLKEQVSRMRWMFVSGGLLGALLIVRPGGSVEANWVWVPLTLVVTNALFQILTSHMAKSETPTTTHTYTSWVGALLTSVLVYTAWTTELTAVEWGLMCLSGLAGSVGHMMLIVAFTRAPASEVTPYLYSGVAFATLAGWLVFAHVPDGLAFTGMALIVGCGWGAAWLSRRETNATH
jgi:drug/metabolite transporter (DMT)-like permease